MNYNIDLRFLIPPCLNLIFQFLQSSQGNPSSSTQYPTMEKMAIPIIAFLLCFLLVSVRLPLSIDADSIELQFANFYLSVLLAVTLLAAVIFPPVIFGYGYLICFGVFMAPCSRSLLAALKRWLQAIPTLIVTCDTADPPPEATAAGPPHSVVLQFYESGDEGLVEEQASSEPEVLYGHA